MRPTRLRPHSNEGWSSHQHHFAAVGAFYAVLLAFVVVALGDMNAAKDNTYVEANALPGLYFSATQFPAEHKAELQDIAVTCARDVVDDEWRLLAHGESSPKVEDVARRMRKVLLQLEPETPKQEALYSAMIERVNVINSARRDRLNEARPSIPGYLWFGLIVGGVLVVGSLYYAHLMDHPFAGTTTVTPDAFRVALKQMGQPTTPQEDHVTSAVDSRPAGRDHPVDRVGEPGGPGALHQPRRAVPARGSRGGPGIRRRWRPARRVRREGGRRVLALRHRAAHRRPATGDRRALHQHLSAQRRRAGAVEHTHLPAVGGGVRRLPGRGDGTYTKHEGAYKITLTIT